MYSPIEERRWTFGARHRPLRSYHSSSSIGAFHNPPRSASVVRRPPPTVGSPQRHRRMAHSLRYTNPDIQKMSGCAHFHYQMVELGPVQVAHEPIPRQTLVHPTTNADAPCWRFRVDSNGRSWTILRSYQQLIDFDRQLHRCVFDRRYSRLNEFRAIDDEQLVQSSLQEVAQGIESYVMRFSELAGSLITCYPVLKWLELDSRGNRFMPAEETPINTPAVAAAFVVREYTASACDELTLKLGDIVSVIEMPPVAENGDASWWKGKLTIARNRMTASDSSASNDALKLDDCGCGPSFDVGYFPSTCVQVFGSKTPTDRVASIVDHLTDSASPPADQLIEGEKRGKVMAFMRDFLKTRPGRQKLPDNANLPKRMFGCDLSEYLTNSNLEVPLVLQKCAATVEKHGVVTGIYRQSGVQSNIQRLRQAFDEGGSPDLDDSSILRDIHCVSSLLKQYF
uniref:Uncharacterized protein n=1 Tax=Plectus sambesii TaxID=2011161 RepID=A0A914XF21_9BILA